MIHLDHLLFSYLSYCFENMHFSLDLKYRQLQLFKCVLIMIHHYNEKVMKTTTIRIMLMTTMILNTTDTDKCLQDLPEAIDGVGMWEVGRGLARLAA